MTQHDVFRNPAARNRKVYPVLVVLQSNIAYGDRRLIAPMMLSSANTTPPPSRAVPQVTFQDRSYALMLT